MNEQGTYRISAFTILEVTIVLAIMSVLITIIASSLNRFQEQLKVASDVRGELNQWYALRSVLWKDFYAADSAQMVGQEMQLFSSGTQISYRIQDGIFERRSETEWVSGVLEAEKLYIDTSEQQRVCHLEFIWKDAPMHLFYAIKAAEDVRINHFFDQLDE